jgi:alpha-glucuronidase
VIKKAEIMPLILARCPGFTPIWEKHQAFWEGKEAGIYNDLGEFATFIVDAYARQEIEPIVVAFAIIEELLAGGDEEVRAAASIGFLEDVRNIASWRPFGAAVFIQWLGPESKKAWAEIEEMWRGKRSLMDVVRAEQAAAKEKPKS